MDCQTFELDFTPYHLYHTKLINQNESTGQPHKEEYVWMLSGSDCCLHIFREDTKKQCFYKERLEIFPELTNLKSIPIRVDIITKCSTRKAELDSGKSSSNFVQRHTAVGFEDGSVELFLVEYVDPLDAQIIKSWKQFFDGPILCVKLFQDKPCGSILNLSGDKIDTTSVYHLAIVTAFEQPIIFRNINTDKMKRVRAVRSAVQDNNAPILDIPIATFIGDFNFDGCNELFVGSYGKVALFFGIQSNTDSLYSNRKFEFIILISPLTSTMKSTR